MSVIHTLKDEERKLFLHYIKEKGYELGFSRFDNGEEEIVEAGLCNDYKQRCELNALYFVDLVQWLPDWPWTFQKKLNSLFK